MELLSRPSNWSFDDVHIADTILRISNIVYNNSTLTPPLDDGLYDQLIVIYQRYDTHYQVGAEPVQFPETVNDTVKDEKIMCVTVPEKKMDSKLYTSDIHDQFTPMSMLRIAEPLPGEFEPITKRVINTQHKYPELVGTLDKCKFTLNVDAQNAGVFSTPGVNIFERDFMHKCLEAGVIHPAETFEMVGELKYDGVSVEAEVAGDTIISAYSRGDTGENIATDLTPIFGGFKFPNYDYAHGMDPNIRFGIKFEAVITKFNLQRLSAIRGKTYANCRNAIIGLLSASDARKYVNFITLIPLSTSFSNMVRADELNFLNHFYNSGEYNRHVFFRGNYQQILFQVKQFVESAEIVRPILPYLIDGVVISFIDPAKKQRLGRVNSVNKWSMAIKFNPDMARTIFMGYTFNIGKSGEVIPMCHFKPCEFLGGFHTKQTIHSYERFKTLDLAIGDEIDVEYRNDVMSYVSKPDTIHNRRPDRIPERFIDYCPYCGSRIIISESGKSAKCPNSQCHERKIMRMVDMLNKLDIRDVAEESVRALDMTDFSHLFHLTLEEAQALGDVNGMKLYDQIQAFKRTPINDYKIMSALSFEGMADEKWKLILRNYTIPEIMMLSQTGNLVEALKNISGAGPKMVRAIILGVMDYIDDLNMIVNNIPIINSKNALVAPRVSISGFRDSAFIDLLNKHGFDCSDKYGVSKTNYALIVADPNEKTSKVLNAMKYGIPVRTKEQFLAEHNIIIQ